MGFIATMSSKGQLTIPKDVRDELKLATGTQLYISVRDGELVARPKNRNIADLAGILGTPTVGAGAAIEDLDEAIGEALAEDDKRIVREWNDLHGKKT
ncbi:AbrB/MazE/SpoVT family DNA-binding domain-containing protein [Mesorhizobium australicum]|uniref:Looped-hinge helix DNA binding domain-containing protein, AbrB family n=1 Tax=Mesorhizobium australicum TaxID=536018 RepID=A0A1X7PW44_9HYPH|nr:AbrB/MazE/SpoVT family DNA-binding domain-containing protein [Mesorhizobium australicum]SMH55773.1 looped-hinge helix DNA binding domain-containing protein, AbrB family [Mesorhizobium australicum]